jgi:hypothetical protein
MNEANRGRHALTIVLMTLVLHSNLALAIDDTPIETQERAVCSAVTDKGLAEQLRAAIDKRYEELNGAHGLSGGLNGTDVTNVVLPYIRPGMSFKDAEEILRCAGFDIGAHPDPTPPPRVNRPKDWYAVIARIAPYLSPRFFGCKVDLYASLLPRNPGEYTSVEEVSATFYVGCP